VRAKGWWTRHSFHATAGGPAQARRSAHLLASHERIVRLDACWLVDEARLQIEGAYLRRSQPVKASDYVDLQRNSKRSHDGGVDFIGKHVAVKLAGQSKYKIPTVEEFDSILSKFSAYEIEQTPKGEQTRMFAGEAQPSLQFCICTASRLDTIVKKFASKNLSSRKFYDELVAKKRLDIIDGDKLYRALRKAYQHTFIAPASMDLHTECDTLEYGNVYLTILGGATLQAAFAEHGPSLFFDNIRDFLGFIEDRKDRQNVNGEILSTLSNDPGKMLERNNGIVLRAKHVERIDARTLRLTDPGIVNGCQTTMCVVHAGESAAAAAVPAKIVKSDDAWEIAKAANHQNIIHRVDLELARFLRPQIVRKVALEAGFSLDSMDQSISDVLDQIYQRKASQEEVRHLALGLFSRRVTSLFSPRYEWVRIDVLNKIESESRAEQILTVLLKLLTHASLASRTGAEKLPASLQNLFKRFFEKPSYRAFVAVLAASGWIESFAELDDLPGDEAYRTICKMADELEAAFIQKNETFERVYHRALGVVLNIYSIRLGTMVPTRRCSSKCIAR
jgi:hypothetical protein